jgi:hypothetical protein
VVNYEPVSTDDFIAIQRLVHRYADAVVHRDAEQWGSCWASDAEWDLGRGRRVVGHAAIVDLWTKAMAGMHAVVQTVDNGDAWHETSGDNDTASGRWYITETFRRATGENAMLRAHYADSYVRAGKGFLFTNRVLAPHYMGPPDLSAPFLNAAAPTTAEADA